MLTRAIDPIEQQVVRSIPQPEQVWVNSKNQVRYEIVGIAQNANNNTNTGAHREVIYRPFGGSPTDMYRRGLPEFMGTRFDVDTETFVFRFVRVV